MWKICQTCRLFRRLFRDITREALPRLRSHQLSRNLCSGRGEDELPKLVDLPPVEVVVEVAAFSCRQPLGKLRGSGQVGFQPPLEHLQPVWSQHWLQHDCAVAFEPLLGVLVHAADFCLDGAFALFPEWKFEPLKGYDEKSAKKSIWHAAWKIEDEVLYRTGPDWSFC